jgi:hypothetical protein
MSVWPFVKCYDIEDGYATVGLQLQFAAFGACAIHVMLWRYGWILGLSTEKV